ncbi:MAG: hypothetical protein ABIJ20_00635 [Nanoarchaeota archaeon]|nr:ribbon-helix-helix domain-containing protein [Nanoarchaeota archaeon]MBU1445413.1 ribbon-helix-helix domain-containing protein [Nanoarchaeota archaeon]MBU2406396.1 ribbon-helix-helix domain-containing protein [Nanoarchaeota archaeon]MBU2420186.1 ribbon-helix-helix domain-containing protein [Nanoarchaeota archaeon]MBU2475364.1 ribbon-helix-helix domain-containing protein [Nanoarchaeota archaeon]
MKKKLSITVDEVKIVKIEALVSSGKFRNKSHFIEFAVDNFLNEEQNER